MKKMFLSAIIMVMSFLFVNSLPQHAVNADNITVSSMSAVVNIGTSIAPQENENYILSYNNATTPYRTATVSTTISTSPIDYQSLTESERSYIHSLITWNVNGQDIVFDNNQYTHSDYKLILADKDLQLICYKPMSFEIIGTAETASCSVNIISKYATLNSVTIETQSSLEQDYENFQTIVTKAVLHPQEFLDPNLTYVYIWKLNDNILNTNTNEISIDKSMIKIGEYTLSVTIENLAIIGASVDIKITTSQDYNISVSHQGNLTMELGSTDNPIFTAEIPVLSPHTFNWFLKSPNSQTYKNLNIHTESFTFITADYANYGEYKILVDTIIDGLKITSTPIIINIKSKEIITNPNQLYEIATEININSNSSVQAYKFSIKDMDEKWNSELIVWYVNGSAITRGAIFNFNPSLAGTYNIQAKLLSSNGMPTGKILTKMITVNAQSVETSGFIVGGIIALACLLIVLTASIIISNKIREKIW